MKFDPHAPVGGAVIEHPGGFDGYGNAVRYPERVGGTPWVLQAAVQMMAGDMAHPETLFNYPVKSESMDQTLDWYLDMAERLAERYNARLEAQQAPPQEGE